MRHVYSALGATLAVLVSSGAARADLEFCNDTAVTQSVSVAYQSDDGFTSEGWWNIEPGDCVITLPGALQLQYYYYRAEVDGGEFDGEGYLFCTTPEAYTIVGDEDCRAQGYEAEDFAEIDTGPTATRYTHTLVDAGSAGGGLQFCNETDNIQSISIAYMKDDTWVSEGWWNIDPGGCETPAPGALQNQFYYYRAEVDGGDFDGEGYFFCTTPEAYTIIGDEDCRSRGYESEDFAEIDTGPTATSWTVSLVDPGAVDEPPQRAPETPSKEPEGGGGGASAPPKGGEFPTFERKEAPRPGE